MISGYFALTNEAIKTVLGGKTFKFVIYDAPKSLTGTSTWDLDRGVVYQPVEKGVIYRVSRHSEAYRGEGGFAVLRDDEDDLSDQDGSRGGNKHEQGAISPRHGLFRGTGADELAHQQ